MLGVVPTPWRSLCLAAALTTLTVAATPPVQGGELERQAPVCGGRSATIVGTADADKLTGTRGPDVIVGLGGPDRIAGRGGRDVLCGGKGSDDLAGNRAADRLFGGLDHRGYYDPDVILIGDTLSGGPGSDRINPGQDPRETYCEGGPCNRPDELSFKRAEHGVRVRLNGGHARGEGHDTFSGRRLGVVGSRFSDHVWGTDMRNTFDLGKGADVVRARAGDDSIWTDPDRRAWQDDAMDKVWAGSGRDHVYSNGGIDTVFGGPDGDTLTDEGSTVDYLRAGAGSDAIGHRIVRTSGLVISGGPGRGDSANLWGGSLYNELTVDLRTGAFEISRGDKVISHQMPGFDNISLGYFSGHLTFYGTDQDNSVSTDAQTMEVSTFAGNDYILAVAVVDSLFDGGDGVDGLSLSDCAVNTCISIENNSP